MTKIGILGGTFDPIHIGHIRIADKAFHALGLDKVILIPAGDPPHKVGKRFEEARHRLEMARIAAKNYPYFEVSDIEITRNGPSYSYLTLEEIKSRMPDAELFIIVGADSLAQMHTWREPQRIFNCAQIVCLPREGAENPKIEGNYDARVVMLGMPKQLVSSTDVRALLSKGGSVRGLLPPGVLEYIEEHKLYGVKREMNR